MEIIFTENGWKDYLYWQQNDKKVVKKINALLKNIKSTPFEGIGKPEALKYDLAKFWSRRIDKEYRLVYHVTEEYLYIISCRYHY